MKLAVSIIFILAPSLALAEALGPNAYGGLGNDIVALVLGTPFAFFAGIVICAFILSKIASLNLITPFSVGAGGILTAYLCATILQAGFILTAIISGFLAGFLIAAIWNAIKLIRKP